MTDAKGPYRSTPSGEMVVKTRLESTMDNLTHGDAGPVRPAVSGAVPFRCRAAEIWFHEREKFSDRRRVL